MIAKIYTLNCSKTGIPFYIGCTLLGLSERLIAHKYCAKRQKSRLYTHIRESEMAIEIELLDKIVIRSWRKKYRIYNLEAYWIEQFRQWGFRLVNASKNLSICNKCYDGKTKVKKK